MGLRLQMCLGILATTVWLVKPAAALEVKIEDDPYKEYIKYEGAQYTITAPAGETRYFLSALKYRSDGRIEYVVFYTIVYQAHSMWHKAYAYMRGGKELPIEEVGHQMIGCSGGAGECEYLYGAVVRLPANLLQTITDQGIDIKIEAGSEEAILKVPSGDLSEFRSKVEATN